MYVFVAAYSPIGRSEITSLGGSRKIEALIELLLQSESDSLLLVNTAHNETNVNGFRWQDTKIGSRTIKELILPTYGSRPLGKLRNMLFDVKSTVEKVYSYGNPSFVWCYNPYAFESLFANQMSKRGAKIVLEFEDACLSRRKTSIKPYVDYSLWRWRFPRPAMGFAVNRELYKQLQTKCDDVHLLPGIVPDAFEVLASQNPPFRNASGVKIGYFGGLTTEKGADKVLQLHDMLPSDVQFGTTGGGPLQAAFEAKAKQHANFRYLGAVSQAEMIKEIFTCDVLLNPHKPLSEMNSGVFPFKVMEAIATERVVISTNIDEDEGMNKLLSSVRFVEHSVEAFANAIHSSRAYHEENRDKIKDCAQQVRNAFSESAIRSLLKTRLLDTENGSSS